jgi:predicted RNase H-like HicB family nuclease
LIDNETGVTSQGETKRQAIENLREALILFKEEFRSGD